MDFWKKLKKPILALAPMDGVTDTVFRQIILSVGKPDVLFTEFVCVDALLSKGSEKALEILKFSSEERPIIAQIWGTDPEKFYLTAQTVAKLKFDGIDINMGCPDKKVVKVGAGAALIKNSILAQDIIRATIKGAKGLPVSVKTRIGFDQIETEKWVKVLLETPISALTLHLRTTKELSKPTAHWEEIKKAIQIRDKLGSKCLILGNGDIESLKEAQEKYEKYGLDGIMIGRGIFKNPWLFNPKIDYKKVTPEQKIDLLIKHIQLFQTTHQDQKHFEPLKKFVKCYIQGFPEALRLREKLMKAKNLEELIDLTSNQHPIEFAY